MEASGERLRDHPFGNNIRGVTDRAFQEKSYVNGGVFSGGQTNYGLFFPLKKLFSSELVAIN